MNYELETAVQVLLDGNTTDAWQNLSQTTRQKLIERCVGAQKPQPNLSEETLRRNEEHLRLAMSAAPMWTWELELDTDCANWKERLLTKMCSTPDFSLCEDPGSIHPDDCERVFSEFMQAIALEQACRCEFRTILPDGTVRWSLSHGHVVSDPSDHKRLLMGVMLDITARKQLEDQYHQSQKMEAIGRLAGGVAHDFNNLLTVISGYCHVLLQEFDASDARRSHIVAIRDSGDRAARLTKQLLAFSRKTIASPRIVDLNALLINFEHLLGRLIGEHIVLSMNLTSERVNIYIDPVHMEQVVANLGVNARDAMETGGQLKICTELVSIPSPTTSNEDTNMPPGRYAVLTISDTGVGMAPSVLTRVFEPFFTTKPASKGTGLGLSVVHGIVTQSGGTISITSHEGVGTSFKISLPFVEGEAVWDESTLLGYSLAGCETILLVDDEETVRRIARVALEAQGYNVLEAASADQGLALYEQNGEKIKLVVSDLAMPGKSGRSMVQSLRERFANLRVLFISGYTEEFQNQSSFVTEADAFLAKPFKPSMLARKVRWMLDHSS